MLELDTNYIFSCFSLALIYSKIVLFRMCRLNSQVNIFKEQALYPHLLIYARVIFTNFLADKS